MVSSQERLTLFLIVLTFAVLSIKGHKLTLSGTAAAIGLGLCVSLSGFEYLVIMLVFYVTSNIATQYNYNKNNPNAQGPKKENARTASQVLYKGLFPSLISLLLYVYYDGELNLKSRDINRQVLQSMYIAFYCFCTADTWASEIGMIGQHNTYIITTFKLVPSGVNGGVSVKGTGMSACGGALIGLVASLCWAFRFVPEMNVTTLYLGAQMLALGCFWGFTGSMLDSFLGATMQESLYDHQQNKVIDKALIINRQTVFTYGRDVLDNGQVNLIAGILTSFIAFAFNRLLST